MLEDFLDALEQFIGLSLVDVAIVAIAAFLIAYMAKAMLARRSRTMTKRTAAAAAAAIDAASTAPGNSRLAPTAQLQRLGRVIDTACGHARAASDIQAAASVQIDAAEIALNRLLAEIVGVMPVAITPVVAPPRDASGDPAPVRSGVAGSALAA